MIRNQLRSGIAHVGQALREPEEFAVRWNRGEVNYSWWVWFSLMMTAVLGTTTYGMTMGSTTNTEPPGNWARQSRFRDPQLSLPALPDAPHKTPTTFAPCPLRPQHPIGSHPQSA